jgi:hypothetical protein
MFKNYLLNNRPLGFRGVLDPWKNEISNVWSPYRLLSDFTLGTFTARKVGGGQSQLIYSDKTGAPDFAPLYETYDPTWTFRYLNMWNQKHNVYDTNRSLSTSQNYWVTEGEGQEKIDSDGVYYVEAGANNTFTGTSADLVNDFKSFILISEIRNIQLHGTGWMNRGSTPVMRVFDTSNIDEIGSAYLGNLYQNNVSIPTNTPGPQFTLKQKNFIAGSSGSIPTFNGTYLSLDSGPGYTRNNFYALVTFTDTKTQEELWEVCLELNKIFKVV